MAEIIRTVGDNVKAYVFSEDTEFASELIKHFRGINIKLMPLREDYEDLYLMSMAKHHIIANSSFSWWSAAIAKTRNGITVAPKNWFIDRPSPNLYLDGWRVI